MSGGVASLGFHNGPSVLFRVDPSSINWEFKIETTVIETIGGRVVQVVGATLSDLKVYGKLGQDHSKKNGQGESWRLAEAFHNKIGEMMEYQSKSSTATGGRPTQEPAIFSFSPFNWKFKVYILALDDPNGGGSVTYATGKFSQEYVLTLFIVEDLSTNGATSNLGGSHGSAVLESKSKAIESYINRIKKSSSEPAGFGWKGSKYTGGQGPDAGWISTVDPNASVESFFN